MDAKTEQTTPRLDRDFIQDPYLLYRQLRAAGPVHPVIIWQGRRVWLVARYAEAMTLLLNRRITKSQALIAARFAPGTAGPMALPLFANMLFSDPPDHTRLRCLVTSTAAFSGAAMEQWRPKINGIADELRLRPPRWCTSRARSAVPACRS